MKYLKYRQSFLNEKFESQFLTKTTGWLSKMKLNSKPFIDDLKKICEDNSIPLSTITDNFFDVNILANKALKMRSPEDSINHIWAIKFWFSATDGYKGFSVTPNRRGEKVKNEDGSRKFESFTPEEISILKHKAVYTDSGISFSELMGVDLTKGELIGVDNEYVKNLHLKTGDIIAFYNCGGDIKYSSDYSYNLNWAKIFSSHDDYGRFRSYVAYGKNLSGGSADYYYDENGEEYVSIIDHLYSNVSERNRRYIGSWILSEGGGLQSDNYKVHLYKHTNDDLHVVGATSEDTKDEDPNTWNLSVRKDNSSQRTYNIENYDRGDEKNKSIYKEDLDDSNFAIVFHIDEFLPQMEGDLKDVRLKRHLDKSGALALMSDEEIKKINVEKRLDYLVDKLKLDENLKMDQMSNLKSLLLKIIIGDYAIITRFYDGYGTAIIEDYYHFFNNLDRYIEIGGDDLKKYINKFLVDIKSRYKDLIKTYQNRTTRFQNSYNLIMNSDNEMVKEIFSDILRIGKKLTTKIRSREIVNLYDVTIILNSISAIRNPPSNNGLSTRTIRIMEEFAYKDEVENYLQNFDNNDYNKSKIGLKFIERVIDSI